TSLVIDQIGGNENATLRKNSPYRAFGKGGTLLPGPKVIVSLPGNIDTQERELTRLHCLSSRFFFCPKRGGAPKQRDREKKGQDFRPHSRGVGFLSWPSPLPRLAVPQGFALRSRCNGCEFVRVRVRPLCDQEPQEVPDQSS